MDNKVLLPRNLMATTITVKGQVMIPRKVREALGLAPGDGVEFSVNPEGQIVVSKAGSDTAGSTSRPPA